MTERGKTLPIRRWLALALAAIFFVPALVTATVAATQVQGPWNTRGTATQVLRDNVSRWNDPAWQAATRAELESQGVDFVLVENGRELYRSTADPIGATDDRRQRVVQRVVVPDSQPLKTAYIYADLGPTGGKPWLVPLAGFSTLLLTLGAIAWLLGRTLLKPLAATSRAARQVASGDLEVGLPSSRVREIAELNSAFLAMSAELRASLRHQAELEEERRLFIGAIAHDLRTPLFSLRGYLEGLEQGLAESPEKRAKYVRICREKANVLERLVSDLFAYTKVEYLGQALRREPLEAGALLRGAVEGLRPQAEARGVALELKGPSEACVLEGDEHLLGRAVGNLLDNAVRYTPAGGSVEVTWRLEADRVTFTVADTGPGIAARDLPHLFDPLYRGDPSRNPQTGGVGLGLAIARRILRAHEGDLVAANRVAGGAEFTGWLSRTSAAPAARQTAEAAGRR